MAQRTRATSPPATVRRSKTVGIRLVQAGIIMLALVVLLPKLRTFLASLSLLGEPDWWWIGIALWGIGFSYVVAGYLYVFLVKRPLPVGRLMAVQLASAFTNRLLPNGVGNVTLNARFLHRQGLSSAEATTTAVSNQMLGFIGFLTVLGLLWLRDASGLRQIVLGYVQWWYILILAGMALGGLYVFAMLTASFQGKVRRFIGEGLRSVLALAREPWRFLPALVCSLGITLAQALCLYASIRAMGVVVTYEQALLAYVAGAAIGSAAPTPGGLGAVEAALVTTLAVIGVTGGDALVAAFIYRLVSLWLPLLPGFIAFRILTASRVI